MPGIEISVPELIAAASLVLSSIFGFVLKLIPLVSDRAAKRIVRIERAKRKG